MLNKLKEIQKKIDSVVISIEDFYKENLNFPSFYSNLEEGEEKDLYKTFITRMEGVILCNLYKNIECSENRGLNITINKNTSKAISIDPNGKESCKILMYNGMDKYCDKKEELETVTYID
jgi:hypothetical protein